MTVKLGGFLSEILFTSLFVKLVKLIHCPWGYNSRSYSTVSSTHIVLLATPHGAEVQLARGIAEHDCEVGRIFHV